VARERRAGYHRETSTVPPKTTLTDSPATLPDVVLDVPLILQGPNCGCGLAATAMALCAAGVDARLTDLERHPLVLPKMLESWGIGPGRLGRIALALGARATLIDPSRKDVGASFLREGGRWVARGPSRGDIERALRAGFPAVACIPDKREAFPNSREGSHWVLVRGVERGEFLIHDPAPWRRATRCLPGYWESWTCSLLVVEPPGADGVFSGED
jgi:hypothetical protein